MAEQHKLQQLITEHIDLWTGAVKDKSSAGRGSSGKRELYGIKKLRELILELAVRGKLVAQDPNDEPASVLLERIAAEKAELVKQGKIKKPKKLPEIAEDEKPFELPEGWEWCRIQEVGHDLGQKQPQESFSYIDVGSIDKVFGVVQSPSVIEAADAPSRARKIVKQGTVIYSTIRPYLLNIAIIDKQFEPEPIASTAFAIVHPLSGIVGDYVYRYLRSLSFVKYVESVQTGVAYPAINDKQFQMGVISVPPYNEQHRIVAKVDELMALCDQLEQQTEASLDAHQTLVQTLLDTLLQSTDAEELEQNWQRLSAHFDLLITTEQSIDQLKQTILQLAVMGKLVPQNPNDEPASELIQKNYQIQAELFASEGLKTKAKREIYDEEDYLGAPSSWEPIRLGNIAKFIDYRGKTPRKIESGVRLITAKNIKFGFISLEPEEFISENEYSEWMTRGFPRIGDILFTPEAPLGNVALVDIKSRFALAQRAICLQLHIPEISYFLKLFIMSANFQNLLIKNATGTTAKGIKASVLKELVVYLPPKSEQNRIVAKVDQLMTLCDHLKAKLADSKTTQLNLTDALVAQAV